MPKLLQDHEWKYLSKNSKKRIKKLLKDYNALLEVVNAIAIVNQPKNAKA